jgi:hypothetical protein
LDKNQNNRLKVVTKDGGVKFFEFDLKTLTLGKQTYNYFAPDKISCA